MKKLTATICLTIAVLLGSTGMSSSKGPYSFDVIDGTYICNKITYIYGFDPYKRHFGTYDETKRQWTRQKICGGKCNKIRDVSKDADHISVNVKVLPQTVHKKNEMKRKRIERGCSEEGMGGKRSCSKAWSGPVVFGYEVVGDFFKGYPKKKLFKDTCTHQGTNIFCTAEDREITFKIWYHFVDKIADEIGIKPKPDLGIFFSTGGFGRKHYGGLSLTHDIGRFYCKKFN
jgi:hypothetical protein